MRYATKTVILDGKQYNPGDIVPDTVKDEETAKLHTKGEKSSPIPKKGSTEPKSRKTNLADAGLSSVNAPGAPRVRRSYRPRKPKGQ